MKKLFLAFLCIISLTGCFKKDSMENIEIYTTIYPIEYITQKLYGEYSTINSVYPNGVNVQIKMEDNNGQYTLTDDQLTDYSNADLLVFNSLLYENNYVKTMLTTNKNLKIVNATDHLSNDDIIDLEELWLDPARMITLSRNIKNGLNEYITNYYIKQDLDNNFNLLKEDLDKLDSKLSNLSKDADNKILVAGNDVFKFLEKNKYNLKVYSLEENSNLNEKIISDVKELIATGQIKYIYLKQYEEPNETIKQLIKNTDIQIIKLHMITNLTETELTNKKNYFSLMNENMELLKKGLYTDYEN